MKDWFLAWSNISADPFGMEDWFLTWPSVSVEAFPTLVDGCECWAFLTGMWDVFPHGQM